ncbi:MAG: hypothetical protein ACPGXL_04315 [Chitinophagales bacterium]
MRNFRRVFFLLFMSFFALCQLNAQNVATFFDKQGRFHVFDHGETQQLEHLEVRYVRVGGNFLIYQNPKNQLMYYENGKAELIDFRAPRTYTAMQYYTLNTAENGKVELIYDSQRHSVTLFERNSNRSVDERYALGDSILAYIHLGRYFKAYYNGIDDEIGYMATDISSFKAGDNTIGFIDDSDVPYIYYNREVVTLAEDIGERLEYDVGNNFMAYINIFGTLSVYDAGFEEEVSNYTPMSYEVGDNLVAFVTDNELFKVYWEEEVIELDPSAPRWYQVIDNTLVYVDAQGYFHVFDKGEDHILETFAPRNNMVGLYNGIVAYQDLDGRLRAYYEGETVKVSEQIVDRFRVVGRVILYELNNGETKIYWKE